METDNEDSLWELIMKIHYGNWLRRFTIETDNEDTL